MPVLKKGKGVTSKPAWLSQITFSPTLVIEKQCMNSSTGSNSYHGYNGRYPFESFPGHPIQDPVTATKIIGEILDNELLKDILR